MPFVSQAQRGLFYHKKETGEFSPEMVKHWEEATPKGKKLPARLHPKAKHGHSKHAFVEGFKKVAIIDLPDEARYGAIVPMQDYVPGRIGKQLDTETGQRRKTNFRTDNVRNEDREFNQAIKHDVANARRPKTWRS
jgi:hypothetical protein